MIGFDVSGCKLAAEFWNLGITGFFFTLGK